MDYEEQEYLRVMEHTPQSWLHQK